MRVLVFGATSTIAQDLQKIWASRGYRLILIGRNLEKLNLIKDDLVVRGAKSVEILKQDMLEFQNAEQLTSQVWHMHSGLDIAFFAHGVLGDQRSDEKSVEKTMKILDANLNSHIAYLTPLANLFEEQGRGSIAVISSVAGDRGKQSNYIYCAAKAGMIAFLSGLRNRLFSKGVHVIDLRLGFVDTAMTAQFKKGALWVKSPAMAKMIDQAIQTKKDVAYLPKVWFLIMLIIKSIPEFLFKRLKL